MRYEHGPGVPGRLFGLFVPGRPDSPREIFEKSMFLRSAVVQCSTVCVCVVRRTASLAWGWGWDWGKKREKVLEWKFKGRGL